MTTEAKVGAFVLGSLSILALILIGLVSQASGAGGIPYKTYVRDAGGIEPGAAVLFGGVESGRVKAVRPLASDPTQVEILLELKKGTPINSNSIAKLGALNIMSGPVLFVTTGSNDARRLAAGESISSQEAVSLDSIVGKLSQAADNANTLVPELQKDLSGINMQAQTLLGNLNTLTGGENQKKIEHSITQVDGLLTDTRPKINQGLDRLSALTQHADALMAKLSPVLDHTDATIQNVNGTVTELREPIRSDLVELQTTLKQTNELVAHMQVFLRANEDNTGDTIENLRITTENLNQLTDELKQRPFSLIRVKQSNDRKVPK
ncbi:MlaD family protein [Acidicapsa ligni]|uniref:MlaD family protein n=1 Tax=Acidicapsa ligni TaxID=542300 RepID=UPI0021DFD11B|nr:MlaD family protein [Acidicapsa ligni]